MDTIIQVHLTGRAGNILVFVSGEKEISMVIRDVRLLLKDKLDCEDDEEGYEEGKPGTLACYNLLGALPVAQQDHTVDSVPPANVPGGRFGRKLIVSTNIAETSITIRGVTHVIDSCRAMSKVWHIGAESWSLREQWISKAQIAQRSGRAGRTSDGESYIMLTKYAYLQLPDHSVPEILKGDMMRECLQLLAMDLNPVTFPYIHPPASETICKALGMLDKLGLLAKYGLSAYGKKVESFGVDTQLGSALVHSGSWRCSDEIITIVSMVEATESCDVVLDHDQDDYLKRKISDARAEFKVSRQRSSYALQHVNGLEASLHRQMRKQVHLRQTL